MSDKTIRIVAAIFGLALPLAAILSAAAAAAAEEHAADASGQLDGNRVTIQVDCGQAINTMRGGLGASWHAIEATIPYGVKHPYFDGYSHGGSGWGGYPPADDERAWQQIYRHAALAGPRLEPRGDRTADLRARARQVHLRQPGDADPVPHSRLEREEPRRRVLPADVVQHGLVGLSRSSATIRWAGSTAPRRTSRPLPTGWPP